MTLQQSESERDVVVARAPRASRLSAYRLEIALVIAIAVTWAVFGAVGRGFFSQYTIFQNTQLIASSLVIGLAQMVVLAIGRLNLAVGGIGVVSAMIMGNLLAGAGLPLPLALVVSVAAGGAVGLLIGLLEANTRFGSFVITLASLSVLTGGMYVITRAQPVPLTPDVRALGAQGFISPSISFLIVPAIVIAALLWYLYTFTTFGRQAKAIGFNEKAALTSGVRVKTVIVWTFVISGALCAVAAFLQAARVGAVLPSLGDDWVIASFIVPVLGGTALTGGRVSVIGAVLGAIFINSANTGLISIGLPSTWLIFAQGFVLLVVIVAQSFMKGRRSR